MEVYHGIFAEPSWKDENSSGWQRVQEEFGANEPEPFKVIYANYEYECYSGDADVFWENSDGTYGYVSGGHCSCYGLEDQWEPEIYTAEQLRGQIERANYGFFARHADLIRSTLPND